MARFVGLANKDGNKSYAVYVNPDHVVCVCPKRDDVNCSHVYTSESDDAYFVVHGTPLEVATFLGEGRPAVMNVKDPKP